MALTDYRAVSSQIGGGTVGQNSMRNFNDEMNMGSTSLMAQAKSRANKYQADALVEMAELGAPPSGGGGPNWGAAASGVAKGLGGLFGQGGGSGMGTGTYDFGTGVGIGDLGVSGDYGAGSWDLGGGIFSSGALDSIGTMGF